jgi:hypothetical protein
MNIEMRHRWSDNVLFAIEAGSLKLAVELAVQQKADLSRADLYGADLSRANLSGADLSRADLYGADLSRANLSGADLSGANLYGANLSGANLYGANLSGADLYGADLSRADLRGANLSRANLYGADLSGANLSRADLSGANLRGADLSGADLYGAKNAENMVLDTGETLQVFRAHVVPALMAVGGHAVPDEAWTCHSWENCPMAHAFGVHRIEEIPLLYQPRVAQFIRLFDAGLIQAPRGQGQVVPQEDQA